MTEEEAVELYQKHGGIRKASLASGADRNTIRKWLHRAAEKGLLGTKPVLPGFRISKTTAVTDKDGDVVREFIQQKPELGEVATVPVGHIVKGVSTLVGADGRKIVEWVKTREDRLDPLALAEALKATFADYQPSAGSVPAPDSPALDLLTFLPCNDWHLGMFAWGKQVGANWDLKIGEDAIGRAVEDTIARSPASAECIVLGGGDLLHSDTARNETSNGTPQDVDGRYEKIVLAACRLMERTVDSARRRHEHVIVRILPGNHDEHACVAVAYHLLALYRHEPRVTVDVDPSMFFWFRFGRVMLGATHGHKVKIEKMPGIMAHRRAEDWGATRYRYVHGFHLHHSAKYATEGEGVVSEVHQAPIPQDAWHFGSGYLSGRSLQAITYHREFGEVGRVRVAMLDAV